MTAVMPAVRPLAVAVFVAGLAISAVSSPGVALAMGLLVALTVGLPVPAVAKWHKPLLQGCVVLLGFGMDLTVLLDAGSKGFMVAAATIALTMGVGALVGRVLAVAKSTSTLISAGTAICGGSAIAAVGSVIGAAPAEMSIAMGTVFVLNAIALYVFPPLGHLLGLTELQFGVWSGVAIHDVSSVVGASAEYGPQALQIATAVKLSRALWIVPLTFAAAFAFRGENKAPAIPWFIGLFLLASVVRSQLPMVADLAPALLAVARAGFSTVLFLIGAGLSMATLRAVGWRPMAQGVVLWLLVSATALFAALFRAP